MLVGTGGAIRKIGPRLRRGGTILGLAAALGGLASCKKQSPEVGDASGTGSGTPNGSPQEVQSTDGSGSRTGLAALFNPNPPPADRPPAEVPAYSKADREKMEAQQRATARYPELAVVDSPLNKMFLLRMKRFQSTNPVFFENPEWPTELAKQCAADLPPPAAGTGR